MPLILGTNSIKDTAYNVANSLRFNSSSSDDLVYTPSSTGNRRTFTWSVWVKRSKLGVNQMTIFKKEGSGSDTNGNGNADYLGLAYFNSDDTLQVARNQEGDFVNVKTTRVFRDVSAWYHVIVSIDTTQGTGSNRVRCWVNGTEESLTFTVTPTQNREFDFNQSGEAHHLGSSGNGSYLDGYLTECVFLDGTAVTGATDFGEFSENENIWRPIDVSGLTFGTNGFYLDFENSGSLGADVSGNGNNFTVNNLTSIDQTTDTCTNNFATMNPLDTFNSPAISDGNTVCPGGSSGDKSVRSTIAISQGKWYWEVNCDISNALYIGIINTEVALAVGFDLSVASTNSVIYNANGGGLTKNGSAVATYTNASNATIGFALDLDAGTLKLSKDGVFFNSGNAVATGIASDTYSPVFCPNAGGSPATAKVNFGNPAYSISSGNSDGNGYGNFEYSVPSGYYALNTKNLAEYG